MEQQVIEQLWRRALTPADAAASWWAWKLQEGVKDEHTSPLDETALYVFESRLAAHLNAIIAGSHEQAMRHGINILVDRDPDGILTKSAIEAGINITHFGALVLTRMHVTPFRVSVCSYNGRPLTIWQN